MLNPDDLIDGWVVQLRGVTELVDALGGAEQIQGYKDSFPHDSNLRRQILQMDPGSILVVFVGTDTVRLGAGGAWSFRHQFLFVVRAPEGEPGSAASYAQLWSLFVNGIPSGSSLPLLHTEIDPACDPMDRGGPGAQRQSLLISVDGATLDYFEFRAALIERAA